MSIRYLPKLMSSRTPCLWLAVSITLLALAAQGLAVRLVRVGTFDEPVFVTAPPGDTRRVFVVERTGTVRIVVDGHAIPRPFVDLRSRVSQPTSPSDERGLLSIAFAPDYARSGRLYVAHTVRRSRPAETSDMVVDEYRASPPDAARVDPGTRRRVLRLHAARVHFGGQIAFGPDGMLWLGPGDGRGPGDPLRSGQNRSRLQGKILRIDPRPGRRLAAPGNPFMRGGGAKLVWAYGLRNPYRFSFDRLTGDLTIGDVGQSLVEEIDFVARNTRDWKGANFGWSVMEGRYLFRPATPLQLRPARRRELPRRYVAPVIEHLHSRGWCAIIGGYVVRDRALPELYGRYVYGDFCRGRINAAKLRPGRRATPRPTALRVPLLSSFGEDGCGRVYVTSLNGPVYRLASSGRCAGPAPTPFQVPIVNAPKSPPTPPQVGVGWLEYVRRAFPPFAWEAFSSALPPVR